MSGRGRGRLADLAVAFIAGWTIMQLEILGGRMLAPWFGYSIYQWGALIGTVMTALAAGYWLGGRIGDGRRPRQFLLGALLASLVFVLVVPFFAAPVMSVLRSLGPGWGAFFASAVLLGLPSVLLATTSPIVVRLTAGGGIAQGAGNVYAVSTAGSIAGTFVTAFLIIPELGTLLGQYLAGGVLALAVALVAWRASRPLAAGAAVIALAAAYPWSPGRAPGTVYQAESVHNLIEVRDAGPYRLLFLNWTAGAQTVMRRDRLLTGGYYDFFLLGPHLTSKPDARVLLLGVAGGVVLKQMRAVYPRAHLTGVDLDPAVLRVGRRFFGLQDGPRLRLVADDARWFLSRTGRRFDVIALDLYVTGHIPFFTTTREFFALVARRLTPGGVVMLNLLAPGPDRRLVAPFVRTLRTRFPHVYRLGRVNHILIASRTITSLDALKERLAQTVPSADLAAVLERARAALRPLQVAPAGLVFTDDRNDVEFRSFDVQKRR